MYIYIYIYIYIYARGDTERSDYKINRNTNQWINIVTMIVSRIIEIIKLIDNELNKNELVSLTDIFIRML